MSSVASEASAVRHSQLGQGPRNNVPSAEPADKPSPFAALLDGANDAPAPPKSPPPASPPPPTSKPPTNPDRSDPQSSSPETAPGAQKSDSPDPKGQASEVSPPPSKGPKVADTAETALGALAKKAGKSIKADANVDAPVANSAADGTAGTNAADATAGTSTAATIPNAAPGDQSANSASNPSDTAPAVVLPTDPSANQLIPVTPQPVAAAISAPLPAAAPATIGDVGGNGNGGGSGTGQDAAQIAALSGAAKAGAAGGKAEPAGAEGAQSQSGGTTAGAQADGGTKTGAKAADAVASPPSLLPQRTPKDLNSPTGPGQPGPADRPQSPNADGVVASDTASNQAHAQGTSPRTDGTQTTSIDVSNATPDAGSNATTDVTSNAASNAAPNVDPNVAPNIDSKGEGAAPAIRIEDIARLALDPAARHIETAAAETVSGGASNPGGAPAGSAQPSPDGSGLIASAIPTSSTAPTAAPTTAAAAIPIAGLAIEIAAHALAGKNRFEIRLDPPELGRIDVRLDIDRDGKVTSRVVVDRPETLDILRRDAPELERSLQEAGLKTADNALQFSLRDQGGFAGQNPYSNGSPAGAMRVIVQDRDLPPVEGAVAGYSRVGGARSGIDIRV